MKKLTITFDDEKIDPIMAKLAIEGFELDWVEDIEVEE